MKKNLIISLAFSLMLLPFIDACVQPHDSLANEDVATVTEKSLRMEYGIPVDSFNILESRIKPNMSLSVLLGSLNLSGNKIQESIKKAASVFDVRKIRRGNIYKVFSSKDTLETVNYLVYEQSQTDYIVFDYTDSLEVIKNQKKIEHEVKVASGTIESSLWLTMTENDINPLLAMELSDVYAWTIDFFGLQKGDQFKVYYQEDFVDNESVGLEKIYAAWFKHNGREIYAIPFYQDSVMSFFDVDGNSLRKAFLKAPLKFSHISSGFSHSRLHPILKIRRPHHGVDYAAPMGTPVHAIGDGTILKAQYSGGAGHYVKIKHNSIYTTGYMHLSKYGKGIKPGKFVKQGEIIGYVGSTGLSTGAHLDFRVWKNGQNINPLKLEAPPVAPIHAERIEFFNQVKNIWVEKLRE
ncbi:MAG: peptidoglycan DD-metalloendopeptidase family protein [Bacteroidota bacterium]